ncbi:MAG: hypothetical protein M3020_07300 [Myxococcota bacterium]|nr:hypothetical protein [Myxococcota bacterium]
MAWPGYHSGLAIDQLDRSVIGAIAKPLPHAVQDPRPVAEALRLGMGVVLPGQAWRNQLPIGHGKRTGMFSGLPHHRPDKQLDPEARRFSATFAEKYAADHLDAEINAGATLLTTPGHVLAHEGSTGRENELLLARLAVEEFVARRAAAPPPRRAMTIRREIYATVVVQAVHARQPVAIDQLVNAYASLEGVSGYWIIAANCRGGAADVAGYARLALSLQAATGRPAVVSCVGDAHLALLASGVAATCAGVHGMSFAFPPRELPAREGDEEQGLGIHVYHRAVLGNVGPLGADGERARTALFASAPCPCGHHPANRPPRGRRQTIAHNSWAIGRDALVFSVPKVVIAEQRLDQRVQRAARRRSLLGLSGVKPGFRSVPRAAAELRAANNQPGERPG